VAPSAVRASTVFICQFFHPVSLGFQFTDLSLVNAISLAIATNKGRIHLRKITLAMDKVLTEAC
jgi:hypothetical protein